MCKKSICLILSILLLGLAFADIAGATEPNLVGWWKFDETSGTTAYDSSGYGYNGTLFNEPVWVDGYRDGALQFDGTDDYVNLDIGSLIPTLDECTFSIWVNWAGRPDPDVGGWQRFIDFGTYTGNYIYICPSTGAANAAMRVALVASTSGRWDEFDASIGPLPTGWHHVAVTVSESTQTMTLYVDNEVVGSKANCVNSINDLGTTYNNWLGRSEYAADPYFDGSLDDLRIYNKVLSQAEIAKAANPERASIPVPADGSIINLTAVTLQWDAGLYAADVDGHHVYFGDDWDSVNAGTGDTDKGLTSSTTYPLTGLEQGKTYYWRVDEVNGPDIWKGDVWSFTVQPLTAYNPSPPDGAKYTDPNAELAWSPGAEAQQHDVYLGTSLDNVNNATRANPLGVLLKQDHDANSYEPGTLGFDTTYYWRIDEVNGTDIWKGGVWSFTTIFEIPITDPNLVGWWKLDDGEGTIAIDSSGRYNHATLINGPQWAAGQIEGGIQLDGINDHVDLPIGTLISSLTKSTLAIWVNFSNDGGVWQKIFSISTGTDNYIYLSPRTGDNMDQPMFVEIAPVGGTLASVSASSGILASGWHHVAVVLEPDSMQLYLDGEVVGSTLEPSVLSDLGVTTQNWLGRSRWPNDAYFMGSLDDFRIYNYALTQEEILKVMRGDPLIAWNPSPAHGSTPDIEHAVSLSWSPGDEAEQHDVYFGTSLTAVEDANQFDTTGTYLGRQSETTYTLSEALQWDQTYYWRVDEVNAAPDFTVYKGAIWSFTTADFLVVDDFESYDANDNQIWYTWRDGLGSVVLSGNRTGSEVGDLETDSRTEETIVHEGRQSMPYWYNNNKPADQSGAFSKYSEAQMTLDSGRDWTREGVKALTLWFRGYPASVGSFKEGPAGTYTVTATGTDIWDQADEFHFAYLTLSGVGSIEAQVLSVANTDPWAKAGVMIRETLEPGSKFAAAYMTPGNGCRFELRADTNDDATGDEEVVTAEQTEITAPHWVRIERDIGGNFTCYHSSDGSSWQLMAGSPRSIQMGTDVYIGLALTAHNASATCEAKFSNVTVDGDVSSEWINQDIGILVNDPERMYVAVANNTGTPAVLYYDDPNATQIGTWTEWNLNLQDFEDQGVTLADINSIALGFGDRDNPQAGGKGKMYFDDLRLYRPRCVPDKLTLSQADLNNDCVVDFRDIEIMAEDWLLTDSVIATTPVGTDGLVGLWTLDGNANDSSGNANNGTLGGGPQWIASPLDGALEFDGEDDYVDLPIGSIITALTDSTFATWVNWSGQGNPWQRIFDFGTGETIYMFLTPGIGGADDELRFAITTAGGAGESQLTAADTLATGWHHVAIVIDGTSRDMELYLDGTAVASGSTETLPTDLGATTQNWLGRSQYAVDPYFVGSLDDFRIYNQALSQAEIAYLADTTPDDGQLYVLVPSPAELYEAEPQGSRVVNFRDFAVLAEQWLEEQMWPQL